MTSLIAGIDWSSRSLDFALIPIEDDNLDPTCPRVTFRTQALDKHLKGIERIRAVRESMLLGIRDIKAWKNRSFNPAPWAQSEPHHEVSSVWVEEAWGAHRGTDRILLPIFGAIVAAVPSRMSVAALSAKEWRYELEIKKNSQGELRKESSIEYANRYLESCELETITSEHQAEALCVALAGRGIIMKHWARGEIL